MKLTATARIAQAEARFQDSANLDSVEAPVLPYVYEGMIAAATKGKIAISKLSEAAIAKITQAAADAYVADQPYEADARYDTPDNLDEVMETFAVDMPHLVPATHAKRHAHSDCAHASTKAARAKCRRARKA